MDKLNELVEMAELADSVGNTMDCVNPHDILAIAEAFRALEQRAEAAENARLDIAAGLLLMQGRAEAAEAEVEDTDKTMRAYSDQLVKVTAELVAAQAQLAEIAKQERGDA